MDHRRAPLALVAALLALVAACGNRPGAPVSPQAACKVAMKRQLADAMASATAGSTPSTPAMRPPDCEGLDDATLERLGTEVLQEAFARTATPTT